MYSRALLQMITNYDEYLKIFDNHCLIHSDTFAA